jgi:hypothetical protein
MERETYSTYLQKAVLTAQNVLDLNCFDVRTEAILKREIELLQEIRNTPVRAESPYELMYSLEVKSIIIAK